MRFFALEVRYTFWYTSPVHLHWGGDTEWTGISINAARPRSSVFKRIARRESDA
jgi:hypothetical protein